MSLSFSSTTFTISLTAPVSPDNGGTGASNSGTAGDILIGQGASFAQEALSGDGSLSSGGIFTLATVNSSPGTTGDSAHVNQITTNGKGLVTANTSVAIQLMAAAGSGHQAGFAPDPGSTVHAMPYVLTDADAWEPLTPGPNVTISYTSSTGYTITASGGGGSLPTDYISGAQLVYDTTTTIKVATGSAYNPIDSAVDMWTSALTASPTLSASTLYYVYLSAGGTGLTVSTSAPATMGYQGTASKDSSGRRYLGSFLTNSSSQIIAFRRQGSRVYYEADTVVAPFILLSNGTATSSTSVSCSSIVPATAYTLIALIHLTGGGALAAFSCSDGPSLSGNNGIVNINNAGTPQDVTSDLPLNTSQAFTYVDTGHTSYSTAVYVYGLGYAEDR